MKNKSWYYAHFLEMAIFQKKKKKISNQSLFHQVKGYSLDLSDVSKKIFIKKEQKKR